METETNNNTSTTGVEINGAANGHANGIKAKVPQKKPALEIEMYDAPPGTEKHHIVKLEDLENYFQAAEQSGGFKEQYQMLNISQQKPWEVGSKAENVSKNRYEFLLPYDENRVILRKLKNDPDSDYINASYIDGYNRKKAYICTQGPLEKTTADFWRMIWQENVSVIAMTANVIENGKKKCEKYWPDHSTKYGDITVSSQKEDVYLDFTVRTFKLQKAGTSSSPRFMRQYQYSAWPDHGVPAYPLSLITMLQDMKKYQGESTHPVVLHCSAGIGRSGTVMLLDIALEMSLAEGKVDFLAIVDKLRQQRINLVETVEQFRFVHRALIDYHFSDVPRKSCAELVLYFNKLRQVNQQTKKSDLQLQFERLRSLDCLAFKEKCSTALTEANLSKNRNADIVPPDDGRPILKTNPPLNYINAVYVHTYGKQNVYVATQCPLPNTVADFWQMLNDLESTTIVVLNEIRGKDETCPIFWPKSGSLYHGSFKIEHIVSDAEYFNGVLSTKLKIRNTTGSSKSRSLKLFQLHGWHKDDFVPPQVDFVFSLLSKVQKWNSKTNNKPVIVTCYDGSRASGFFCALSFLVRQVNETQYLDVFEAVRTIRTNRPTFVPTVEQYRWLYEAACFLISNKKILK